MINYCFKSGADVRFYVYHRTAKCILKKGCQDVQIKEIKYLNDNRLWAGVEWDGCVKLGVNTVMNYNNLNEPLEYIKDLRDKHGIVILTGTHGKRCGSNWIQLNSSICRDDALPIIARDPELLQKEPVDLMKIEQIAKKISMLKRIEIIDINDMNVYSFGSLIRNNVHVIMAFDYSRNDKAFRHYLRLSPKTAYIAEQRNDQAIGLIRARAMTNEYVKF